MAGEEISKKLAIEKSGLPGNKVDEYLTRGVDWFSIDKYTNKGVDPNTLDVLVNDPEILERAKAKQKAGSDDHDLKYYVIDLIEWEIVYNYNFDSKYYCAMHSHNKGGAFASIAARTYGISLENVLKIPYNPTEEQFTFLKNNGIPPEYSTPLLHQNMKPGGIDLLWTSEVPDQYALRLVQEGAEPNEILEKYSIENTGVSAKVRQEYREIPMPYLRKLTDPQIKVLAANGMVPEYFKEIAQKGHWPIMDAFELIEQGKLNGKVYEEWRGVSVDDTLFGIRIGYNPIDARKADILGRTLRQFHKDLDYHQLLERFLNDKTPQKQPVSNGVPR